LTGLFVFVFLSVRSGLCRSSCQPPKTEKVPAKKRKNHEKRKKFLPENPAVARTCVDYEETVCHPTKNVFL
jgi:hypothetical protein